MKGDVHGAALCATGAGGQGPDIVCAPCSCPGSLQIVAEAGSPKDRRAASRIYPIRKKGNLLLCTLLLGNVSVNALISILMADLTNGGGLWVGVAHPTREGASVCVCVCVCVCVRACV